MAQARAAYTKIARPFDAAVAAVNRDVADGAPWSRFRSDTLAVVRADRAWARHMGAERWPPRVQRYVTAMLRTAERIAVLQIGEDPDQASAWHVALVPAATRAAQ